jgi:multiple sugar transport system substrate-binding protein
VLGLLLTAVGCGPSAGRGTITLRFWAMGREGEVVREMLGEFERRHPGVRVDVQQIPWSAAHEKLLTAYVGGSTPDVAQLGNTWISEFSQIGAIRPLGARIDTSTTIDPDGYFPGIWDTNRIDEEIWGVPWYVDTRLVFYRRDFLERAGWERFPESWDEWRACMHDLGAVLEPGAHAIFLPLNEWNQPVLLGLQAGSSLLRDGGRRGDFRGAKFRRGLDYYVGLFRDGYAPVVGYADAGNVYQEFALGRYAMYVTGPWNLGEFARRLPPELADAWGTAPVPGPTGADSGISLAGGSSLVVLSGSRHPEEAWQLVEFLSEPAQQLRFYDLTGDLPARVECWEHPELRADTRLQAFAEQLRRVRPTPKVPEWEPIAMRVQDRVEAIVRGAKSVDEALRALDADVDALLEKRRWMLARAAPAASETAP